MDRDNMDIQKPKMGLYCGVFNPFHIGHLNIVQQSQKIFWRVIVARGINPEKDICESKLPDDFLDKIGVYTDSYNTLLTDYIKKIEEKYGWDVTLIRGLRNAADLGYEENMVSFLKQMLPELKVVFFMCDPQYRHISSSALRGIEKFSREEYEKYVVKNVISP
jgi:pantetheine-phosphate adenylyltransferase